jgi:hypothetical protein
MQCIFIFICLILTNLSSSIPIIRDNNYDPLVNLNISSDICIMQSINIDTPINETDVQHKISTKISDTDIMEFNSTWEQQIVTQNDAHADSPSLNIISIIFTIPYNISDESIVNKTVFIMDTIHNNLLAILTDICYNDSSFFINYSTIQPLPQDICLYLLLNLTSSMILREIIFCRTIEDSSVNTSSPHVDSSHAVGPSGVFIISQCIIILIMMFIIYAVQTARQKNLADRVSQRVFRSRPYIIIFGNKATARASSHTSINPATTLQVGLNQLNLHRRLTALPNQQVTAAIEEQVLAANDLTSTINDRRVSRPLINRDLIDIKEFTKRISVPNESPTDDDLHSL